MDEKQLKEIAAKTIGDLNLGLEISIRNTLMRRMEQLEHKGYYLGNGYHRAQRMTAELMPGIKKLLPGLVKEALRV